MSEIVEYFETKARFGDEREADLIREKLETLVNNIMTQVENRDERFNSTLVGCGSVYEGTNVCEPNEFGFMIRINALTNKPSFRPCDKGDGYVKVVLDEDGWEEFKDGEGCFNPNLLSHHFKKLVSESLSEVEVPEGLAIQRTGANLYKETWWPVYYKLLGNSGGEENPSGVMYSETHGPATTLYIRWQGGNSYRNLIISVDLALTLDYPLSKLPVQLAKLPMEVNGILQKCGFHIVSAGFDSWRISFSVAEKEILSSSPDGFRACYRVLKVVRNAVSEMLGWDSSLVSSYIFKTVLLPQLFTTGHFWEKDSWSQMVNQALELVLRGVMKEGIHSYFISTYTQLSVNDHENMLRQCDVEEMLKLMKGLNMTFTMDDAREKKYQTRVLQMIDLLDYTISCLFTGKNPTAAWNRIFVNIKNVPNSRKTGWFWNEVTELNIIDLSEAAYRRLIRIWSPLEDFFKQLLATLQGELNLLAQKFYIRTCEKKKKFELEHKDLPELNHEEIPKRQVAFEWLEDFVDCYIDEDNSTLPNLHKAIAREFSSSGFFKDVVDVTVKESSEKGLALLKERLRQCLFMVPESSLMTVVVGYISQILLHSKEVLKRKLDYITIPELDLD